MKPRKSRKTILPRRVGVPDDLGRNLRLEAVIGEVLLQASWPWPRRPRRYARSK